MKLFLFTDAYPWPYKAGSNPGDASEAVGQAFEDIYKNK